MASAPLRTLASIGEDIGAQVESALLKADLDGEKTLRLCRSIRDRAIYALSTLDLSSSFEDEADVPRRKPDKSARSANVVDLNLIPGNASVSKDSTGIPDPTENVKMPVTGTGTGTVNLAQIARLSNSFGNADLPKVAGLDFSEIRRYVAGAASCRVVASRYPEIRVILFMYMKRHRIKRLRDERGRLLLDVDNFPPKIEDEEKEPSPDRKFENNNKPKKVNFALSDSGAIRASDRADVEDERRNKKRNKRNILKDWIEGGRLGKESPDMRKRSTRKDKNAKKPSKLTVRLNELCDSDESAKKSETHEVKSEKIDSDHDSLMETEKSNSIIDSKSVNNRNKKSIEKRKRLDSEDKLENSKRKKMDKSRKKTKSKNRIDSSEDELDRPKLKKKSIDDSENKESVNNDCKKNKSDDESNNLENSKNRSDAAMESNEIRKQIHQNGDKYSEDSESALKNEQNSSGDSGRSSDEDEKLTDDVRNEINQVSKSVKETKMTEAIAQLMNGDTSNSEDEFVPKVNGKVKNSIEYKEMKSVNSEDDDMSSAAKKSKKSKPSSPELIDSDSDAQVIEENSDDNANKKNDSDVKEISDSADSDESEVFKQSKKRRKKKKSDESNDESDTDKKTKKKRRRIKKISDDDSDKSGSKSENGSGSENENNKKGRKNIRKVKRSVNLDEATKTAARVEKERVQRIAERQKLYNESMFDESGRPDEVIKLDKVVLDFDPDTKEPLISVDKGLVEKLKPHQANGVKFMWNACFESVAQIKKSKGSGCILAHCMGLGKTLQVVTLTHTLLAHQNLTKVERVLVVCPLSTVHNWVNEFNMWLKFTKRNHEIEIYELSKYKKNYERSSVLREWLENGGVCVLGYDMFRNLSADNNKKFRKAQLVWFQKALVDPGPDLVVCDEGHLLKNEKTSLSQSMNKVKTLRRIVLTGTPLQNNLKEYYCMVQFVKPNLLGKYNEYLNRFVNPITNGQYTDSTEHDIRIMKRRSHVLHKMLDGAVQRRDYSVLAPFLPPKHEYVLFISLTEIQIKLYSHYMENYSRRPQPDRKNTGFLFPDFQSLQRIWTHPLVLKANSERYEIMQQKKRDKEEDSEGSLVDFIDDDSTTPEESTEEDETSDEDSDSDHDKKKKSKKKTITKRVTRATVVSDDDDVILTKEEEPPRQENPTEWWMSLCSEEELDDIRHSNKLILLLDILKECEAIGDKLLVFSQSLYSLDLIEQFLWKIDEATQRGDNEEKLAGHLGSWSPGIDYFRLDGSTSCENRSIWCKNFNKEDNPRARLFLISTRAGGLGINLVAANRVVIFDMSWNPSHDVQSIFRVYRFGQKKPCYVYRFLALGTMEEKIYERQVTKQAISKRVIDEQQIDRHYAESDLAELYTFCPVPEGPREVPKLPKDRLFADLLKQHDTMIYKYHEHDSLLENKEEETLTEEERKAAWEDYENEKTRPPPIFGGSMLAGFQQQQQHHLAMSALLQQENPGLSEQQVASLIPSFLQNMYQNGDSLLMQRMNAMLAAQNSMTGFKYPQNTMMNANLSSMLNTGTAGSTTGYGNSWQQQQHLTLQRLQQQQAMQANLKYYAGGLGSRDTLDMAALQQQQRAMMMNANVPQRGRPPKSSSLIAYPQHSTKKPPPVTTGDVVDLDSE